MNPMNLTRGYPVQMMRDPWPHIGPDELLDLWEQHAPTFLKIDDVGNSLSKVRVPFLTWLSEKGINLGARRPPRSAGRTRLEAVALSWLEDRAEATVSLSWEGREATGQIHGPLTTADHVKLPAEATLVALNKLLPVMDFKLDRSFIIRDEGATDPLVFVVVTDATKSQFVGACLAAGSVPEAAAKASLDAVNRYADMAAALYLSKNQPSAAT